MGTFYKCAGCSLRLGSRRPIGVTPVTKLSPVRLDSWSVLRAHGNFVLFFTCHDFISPLFRLYSSSTSVCGGSRVVVSGGTCNSLEKLILSIFHSIVANILPHIQHVNLFQFQVDEMWEDSWLRWWSLLTTNCCENMNSINWVFSKTCIWLQIYGHWARGFTRYFFTQMSESCLSRISFVWVKSE